MEPLHNFCNPYGFYNYDPETGFILFGPNAVNFRKIPGERAEKVEKSGYAFVNFGRVRYSAHRLAIEWMLGRSTYPPEEVIDHRNEIRDDNRWNNLRIATPYENRLNTGWRRDITKDHPGVYWSGPSSLSVEVWVPAALCGGYLPQRKIFGPFFAIEEAVDFHLNKYHELLEL